MPIGCPRTFVRETQTPRASSARPYKAPGVTLPVYAPMSRRRGFSIRRAGANWLWEGLDSRSEPSRARRRAAIHARYPSSSSRNSLTSPVQRLPPTRHLTPATSHHPPGGRPGGARLSSICSGCGAAYRAVGRRSACPSRAETVCTGTPPRGSGWPSRRAARAGASRSGTPAAAQLRRTSRCTPTAERGRGSSCP